MNPEMSIRNRKGIFEDFSQIDESIKQRERFETCWSLPEWVGKGSILKVELRRGFELYIMDYRLHERLVVNLDDDCSSAYGLGFLVSGEVNNKIYGIKDAIVSGPGENGLVYHPNISGFSEEPKNTHRLGISVIINPSSFHNLLQGEFARMPALLSEIAEGDKERFYHRKGRITHLMQMAIYQLFNCPYQGLTRRLYLESKALELIVHKLEQMALEENKIEKTLALRPDVIERIHYAGEIISSDLENPPTLFELARMVGLTHAKLNRGFREIYGATVFGYLRKIRLERAKALLEKQRMNVTEAAFSVGYNSLSSFSHAFLDYFGVTPMMCIKRTL